MKSSLAQHVFAPKIINSYTIQCYSVIWVILHHKSRKLQNLNQACYEIEMALCKQSHIITSKKKNRKKFYMLLLKLIIRVKLVQNEQFEIVFHNITPF